MTFAAGRAYRHVHAGQTREFVLPGFGWSGLRSLICDAQSGAAGDEFGFSITVGEDAEMSDAHEPAREDVEEETSNEFMRIECQRLSAVAIGVILPGEGHGMVVHGKDAMIGDGDAVCVSTEIGDDLFGAAKWRFGVNDPSVPAEAVTKVLKGVVGIERRELAGENQLTGIKCASKEVKELASKETGENPDRDKEVRARGHPGGVFRMESAARNDTMEVGVIGEVLTPGVKDGDEANLGAEVFGTEGGIAEGLRGGLKEKIVDQGLI